MNILSHKPRTPEAAAIRDRIFNVLPAASYQMEKLFGLLDIDFSDDIQTACVECSGECKNVSVNWKSAPSFKEPPLGVTERGEA